MGSNWSQQKKEILKLQNSPSRLTLEQRKRLGLIIPEHRGQTYTNWDERKRVIEMIKDPGHHSPGFLRSVGIEPDSKKRNYKPKSVNRRISKMQLRKKPNYKIKKTTYKRKMNSKR